VEQCIAVNEEEEEEEEEGLVFTVRRVEASSIAKLPATTLKEVLVEEEEEEEEEELGTVIDKFRFMADDSDEEINWDPPAVRHYDALPNPHVPESPPNGIFGKAVDAVNTARDIATVLWNVRW